MSIIYASTTTASTTVTFLKSCLKRPSVARSDSQSSISSISSRAGPTSIKTSTSSFSSSSSTTSLLPSILLKTNTSSSTSIVDSTVDVNFGIDDETVPLTEDQRLHLEMVVAQEKGEFPYFRLGCRNEQCEKLKGEGKECVCGGNMDWYPHGLLSDLDARESEERRAANEAVEATQRLAQLVKENTIDEPSSPATSTFSIVSFKTCNSKAYYDEGIENLRIALWLEDQMRPSSPVMEKDSDFTLDQVVKLHLLPEPPMPSTPDLSNPPILYRTTSSSSTASSSVKSWQNSPRSDVGSFITSSKDDESTIMTPPPQHHHCLTRFAAAPLKDSDDSGDQKELMTCRTFDCGECTCCLVQGYFGGLVDQWPLPSGLRKEIPAEIMRTRRSGRGVARVGILAVTKETLRLPIQRIRKALGTKEGCPCQMC